MGPAQSVAYRSICECRSYKLWANSRGSYAMGAAGDVHSYASRAAVSGAGVRAAVVAAAAPAAQLYALPDLAMGY